MSEYITIKISLTKSQEVGYNFVVQKVYYFCYQFLSRYIPKLQMHFSRSDNMYKMFIRKYNSTSIFEYSICRKMCFRPNVHGGFTGTFTYCCMPVSTVYYLFGASFTKQKLSMFACWHLKTHLSDMMLPISVSVIRKWWHIIFSHIPMNIFATLPRKDQSS